METIAVVSPKGGVGKTTITANLGIILGRLGYDTLLIDANPETPNLSLHLGLLSIPVSLREILKLKILPSQATYIVDEKTHIIPAPLTEPFGLSPEKLEKIIESVEDIYDFVILDSPPGTHEYVEGLLKITQNSLLILTPDLPTLAVAKRAVKAAEKNRNSMKVILNKVTGSREELRANEVEDYLEIPVLGEVPFDPCVIRATEMLKPFVYKKCKATKALYKIAEKLTGKRVKENIWQEFIERIFGRKF